MATPGSNTHTENEENGTMLTAADVAAYQRDGYLFPKRVLSSADAANCKAKLDAYTERFDDDACGSGPMTKRAHMLLRWAANLVRNPLTVDDIEDIIGPDILCWSSTIFTKEAGSRRLVSWHQDTNYWGLSSSEVISAWVGLTPATPENGCMRFCRDRIEPSTIMMTFRIVIICFRADRQ